MSEGAAQAARNEANRQKYGGPYGQTPLPKTPTGEKDPQAGHRTVSSADLPEWQPSERPKLPPLDTEVFLPKAVREAIALTNRYFSAPTYEEWLRGLDVYVNQLQKNLLGTDPENPTKLIEAKARLEVAGAIVDYMHQHTHLFQQAPDEKAV